MSGEDPASGDSSPVPDAASAERSNGPARVDGAARSGEDGTIEQRPPESTKIHDIQRSNGLDNRSAADTAADGSPPTADLWPGTPSDPADGAPSGSAGDGTPSDPVDDGVPYELDVYAGLLEALLERGYEFVGFDGELEDGQIVLRHDVDISLERAAAMARAEADLGIASTYCLLVTNPLYDLLAPESRAHLRTIVECGHDVGLHFDPHYYWDEEPAVDDLEARVVADRTALEGVLDAQRSEEDSVAATSIHQPPDWALGARFDAFENTYEPRYFEAVEYVSDSAGKWRTERPFVDGVPSSMQLLVHPGLWGTGDRPLSALLEQRRERCHRRIEAYVGPFGG